MRWWRPSKPARSRRSLLASLSEMTIAADTRLAIVATPLRRLLALSLTKPAPTSSPDARLSRSSVTASSAATASTSLIALAG